MADPKHLFGANMKIGAVPETSKYGNLGSAETIGASGLFPQDWTESFEKTIVYKERGQIGLAGEKQSPVKIGETVAGALTGNVYFDSDPIWSCIATCMGEEQVSGFGALYAHDFRFGENFYNSDNAYGGTLERHVTFGIDTGLDYPSGSNSLVYIIQSFKGSSIEFVGNQPDGLKATITGTGYSSTRTDLSSAAWTGRETITDLTMLSNTCALSFYIDEYASDQSFADGDKIRPESFTITADQGNSSEPDSGSGIGIREGIFTPSTRKVTLAWVQQFGSDDANYGRRDWTDAYNDNTAIQAKIVITGPNDQFKQYRFSRMLLDGPGKPVLDGPDIIAMNYSATCYVPEETLTNDMEGLSDHSFDMKVVNDRPGTYLQSA